MSDVPPGTTHDPLLIPFLRATGEEVAQRLLDEIISLEAMPIIRRIVGALRLGSMKAGPRLEASDVEHDIVVRLVKRLRHLRADPSADAVSDFSRYVGRMSKNVCNTLHRRNNPRWIGVKNRLTYYLSENPQFEMWHGDERRYGEQRLLLCGPKSSRRRERSVRNVDAEGLSQFISHDLAATRHPITDPRQLLLSDLVPRIFEYAGGPLVVSEVVTLIVALWDEGEDEHVGIEDGVPFSAEFDYRQGVVTAYEDRQTLRRLWEEIGRLPEAQQKALLLSMRTPQGRDALVLFSHTNTASAEQLADVLGMSVGDLEKLSGSLPLKDVQIAELLGATRQQVINLRVSARKRLGRRLDAIQGSRRVSAEGDQLTRRAS